MWWKILIGMTLLVKVKEIKVRDLLKGKNI